MAHIAKAITRGDCDALRKALQDADVNAVIKNGMTGLSLAIQSEDIEMVQIFLYAPGVDVNMANGDGLTPLMQSIGSEASSLLAKHPKTNIAAKDSQGMCAIHYAAASESHWALKFLNHAPHSSFDARTKCMKTPLHIAVECGHFEIVEELLTHTVDVNAQDEHGTTSLVKALMQANTGIVIRLLQSSADPKVLSKEGNNALHFACMYGSDIVIEKLKALGLSMESTNLAEETPQQFLDERSARKRLEEDVENEKKHQAREEKELKKRIKHKTAVANSSLTTLLEENELSHLADWLTSKRYLCLDDLRELTFDKLKKARIGNTDERHRLLGIVAEEDARLAELQRQEEEDLEDTQPVDEKRNKVAICVVVFAFLAGLWSVFEILAILQANE